MIINCAFTINGEFCFTNRRRLIHIVSYPYRVWNVVNLAYSLWSARFRTESKQTCLTVSRETLGNEYSSPLLPRICTRELTTNTVTRDLFQVTSYVSIFLIYWLLVFSFSFQSILIFFDEIINHNKKQYCSNHIYLRFRFRYLQLIRYDWFTSLLFRFDDLKALQKKLISKIKLTDEDKFDFDTIGSISENFTFIKESVQSKRKEIFTSSSANVS